MSSITPIHLFFEGLPPKPFDNPPLSASWGAVIHIHPTPQVTLSQHHFGPLGCAPSIAAKYLAVIRALHATLSFIETRLAHSPKSYSIHLHNDSNVCLSQISGHSKVHHQNLKHLHVITLGLLQRFHSFNVLVLSRSHSFLEHAINLATIGTTSSAKLIKSARPVYRPSLSSLVSMVIAGNMTIASHDIGTITDTVYLIDAGFLESIFAGNVYLKLLRDCAPVQIIPSGIDVTALGIVSLPAQVFWPNKFTEKADKLPFLVVDSLPVPVHISVQKGGYFRGYNIDVSVPNPSDVISFDASHVPVQYRNHPYWKINGPLVAPCNEDGAVTGIVNAANTVSNIIANALLQSLARDDSGDKNIQQVHSVHLKEPERDVLKLTLSLENVSAEQSLEQSSQEKAIELQNSSEEPLQLVSATNEPEENTMTDDDFSEEQITETANKQVNKHIH